MICCHCVVRESSSRFFLPASSSLFGQLCYDLVSNDMTLHIVPSRGMHCTKSSVVHESVDCRQLSVILP